MAEMTIHNLDEWLKRRLQVRAAQHERTLEAEAADILRRALSSPLPSVHSEQAGRPGALPRLWPRGGPKPLDRNWVQIVPKK